MLILSESHLPSFFWGLVRKITALTLSALACQRMSERDLGVIFVVVVHSR